MKLVLVIDDEAAVRAVLDRILRRAGYDVVQACNGSEGLERIEQDAPDLVITDLVMPEREGLDTITEIGKRFQGLPVIAMTGADAGELYLSIAGKLGAVRVLSKPFTNDQLLEAVESVFLAS